MIAIGIGCRRGADGASIVTLVRRARALVAAVAEDAVLVSHERKRDEARLIAAAAELGLTLRFLTAEALREVEARIVTPSQHSAAAVGIASVSEAAALAGAGPGARLILPRISGDGVTCAIAEGPGR